ncbi:MAG TPA: alkaline shock response membrane anchor protein AmaP [Thermomicrobiaceae bacterium]|nr:alkaline shock response membrane anchor protein AmaP [Thermomicrobiaceae bacterium]
MNVFNRLLAILVALVLLVAGVAILLVTTGTTSPSQIAGTTWFADRLIPFVNLSGGSWDWALGVSIAFIVIGILLLAFEIPKPNAHAPFVLKQDGLGRVTLERAGLRRLINRAAGEVPGVMEVRSRVAENNRGFDVHCRVSVDPTADVSQVTTSVQQHVQDAVQHFLGRPIAEVQVDAQLEPLNPNGQLR